MKSDKFWLSKPFSLFSEIQIVPNGRMTMDEQLNCITRLLFIIFLILILFNFKYSNQFLFVSLIIIIIIYYINKEVEMEKFKEKYTGPSPYVSTKGRQPFDVAKLSQNKVVTRNGEKYNESSFTSPVETGTFCNDTLYFDPPTNASIGMNQRLNSLRNTDSSNRNYTQNPKTLIAPVVMPPIYDLENWRDNPLITFSQINTTGIQEDMYLSGYAESTCCDYLPKGSELVPDEMPVKNSLISGYSEPYSVPYSEPYITPNYTYPPKGRGIVSPVYKQDKVYIPTLPVGGGGIEQKENYTTSYAKPSANYTYPPKGKGIVSPVYKQDKVYIPTLPVGGGIEQKESYTAITEEDENLDGSIHVQKNQPGWVDTTCGYDAEQVFTAGLPSNLAVGNCEKDPVMKRYNENVFTQTITPGVYTKNQIIEPISSNIGISFQQQFEPVSCERNDKGLIYTQHDPRIVQPVKERIIEEEFQKATVDNVYDPRQYGYGTSYRSYLEPVTGQTRFYYDDINAIKMPNYITRSKIDHLPYADTYGPIQEDGEFGNIHNPHMRSLVQDSFLRDSLQFRDDITERRMRKINSDKWQSRVAPLGPNQVVRRGGK